MNSSSDANLHAASAKVAAGEQGVGDVDRFIYLLSHDVRNSLRALMEIPHWIETDLIDEGHAISGSLGENLKMLKTNASRVDRMLVDLLSFSRVGRMQDVSSIALTEAIENVIDNLSLPNGFVVTQDIACGPVHIGERDVLTLFSALVSNAVKHHHKAEGKIHISARQNGGECIVMVQDDGPGIPEKYRDRAFEELTTLKPRDEVEGSGMGLAIVKKIARTYGGKAAIIDSENNIGATIRVTFQM